MTRSNKEQTISQNSRHRPQTILRERFLLLKSFVRWQAWEWRCPFHEDHEEREPFHAARDGEDELGLNQAEFIAPGEVDRAAFPFRATKVQHLASRASASPMLTHTVVP